ncbi:MAG: hypothetical protein DHS20C18_39530 [Saprospiraceae bacterium]|nr:MAG: hypothetical protein DHS20C18_39530 [Saprospiraceae bacterium]
MTIAEKLKNAKGYQMDFIDQAGKKFNVPFPRLGETQKQEIAYLKGSKQDYLLHYQNYSVIQNKKRKLPFFAASNIDGVLFKELARKDSWRLDPRIERDHQWGSELYKADKSDFDKGHLTKREDVQWGETDKEARMGAELTFFYTNAVPQVGNLNRKIWRLLEDYILKTETLKRGMKINMFTGPVLDDNDPVFKTEVNGDKRIKIPTLFWKVIYFRRDDDDKLYKLGFLMGQEDLLLENDIVFPRESSRDIFTEFEKAGTYQVSLSTIEELTNLQFPPAYELYKKSTPTTLPDIIKRVQAKDVLGGENNGPDYEIKGLVL